MRSFSPYFSAPARGIFALVLCVAMLGTACTTSWITQAEQIVAVALPIATNILNIVAAFQGKSVDAATVTKVQGVTTQVGNDLNTVQTLLQGYNSANATMTVQKINVILADVQTNLNALLTGFDIKDQDLKNRITGIVGIVIASVQTLEGVLPAISGQPVSMKASRKAVALNAKTLKAQYNALMLSPTGNPDLDAASRAAVLR